MKKDPLHPEVSIVIPAYNEEQAIGKVVTELVSKYPDYEILVINDGSIDKTAEVAKDAGANVISHRKNSGYGSSWKSGIINSKAPIIVFFDGDDQMNPDDVEVLLEKMQLTGADMVSGARTSAKSSAIARRPGKLFLRALAQVLINSKIPDLNCGLRAIKKDTLQRYMHLLPNGYSASTTSLMAFMHRGYYVEFTPVSMKQRVGKSSVKFFADGFGTILLIIRLVALFNPLRIFLPISLLLFSLGSIYSLFEIIRFGLGIPTLGAVVIIGALQVFFTGIVCDQVSALRLERYETPETKRNSK